MGLLRDGSEGAGRDPADVGSANFERDAEMSLAKTDRRILGRYLELGDRQDLTQQMLDEHELTTQWVLKVLDGDRLLSGRRVLGRAVELRVASADRSRFLRAPRVH